MKPSRQSDNRPKPLPSAALSPRERAGEHVQTAAMAILLACMVAHTFLGEMNYRLPTATAVDAALQAAQRGDSVLPADRTELARVTLAGGLLLAGSVWLLGSAIGGAIRIRFGWLGGLMLAFAVLGLVSALRAPNHRWALDAWFEQVSLLAAAFLALQLCRQRRALALVLVVLAGLAGVMAAKASYQVAVEIPEAIRSFEENPADWYARFNTAPGSPKAIALKNRLYDRSALGYVALANVFASMLLVLAMAAGGLAVDRLRAAAGPREPRKSGEIDVRILLGVLLAIVALAAFAAIALTGSLGGILSAAVAVVAAAVVYFARGYLARTWKKWLLVLAGAFLAAAAAIVLYGSLTGQLPTKTITFRWLYWSASGRIVADDPLWGAGPANFGTAYLQHREVRGEEAVKNPHNLFVHALAEYGLPAGACLLASFVGLLVLMCRPRPSAASAGDAPSPTGAAGPPRERPGYSLASVLWVLTAVVGGMLVARLGFAGGSANAAVTLLEGVVPAIGLVLLLALTAGAAWPMLSGRAPQGAFTVAKIALGCAAGGFFLHEMINFATFVPATAGVFLLAAAAVAGQSGGGRERVIRTGRFTFAALPAAMLAVAISFLWLPVAARTALTQEALDAAQRGDLNGALEHMEQAAEVDPLDTLAAADVAELRRRHAPKEGLARLMWLDQSYTWAQNAIQRDRRDPAHQVLAAEVAMELTQLSHVDVESDMRKQSLQHWRDAVRMDPQNLRLRVKFAHALLTFDLPALALHELDEAQRIDQGLLGDSSERLSDDDRRKVDLLRAQAQRMLARPTSRPN